jgi:cysteine-rich secretory family protein
VLCVPASLFALKCQTFALLLLADGVCLWALLSVASPAVAADAASVTLEREVHALVNAHRQAIGLRPLAYNEEITRQARRHSQALARGRGDLDHRGAEEHRVALSRSLDFTGFAENMATNNCGVSDRNGSGAGMTAKPWTSTQHGRDLYPDGCRSRPLDHRLLLLHAHFSHDVGHQAPSHQEHWSTRSSLLCRRATPILPRGAGALKG